MPVSSALLVSAGGGGGGGGGGEEVAGPVVSVRQQQPGGQQGQPGQFSQFSRGEKSTSSVRLRKRRDDVTQPGRKINRHSGDFSYFAPRKEEVLVKTCDIQAQRDTGDWNYITFPQGVPAVQEVRIDLPRHQHPHHPQQHQHHHQHHQHQQQQHQPCPVKVTMRDGLGVNQVKLRTNLNANRGVSASVMNIQEQQGQQQKNYRKSGDFSQSTHYVARSCELEDVNVRRRPHARSHSQQPIKSCNNPSAHITPPRPGQTGQQPSSSTPVRQSGGNRGKKEANNVAKRCSGEFEFKRINRRSGDYQLSQVLAQELDKAEEQSFVERMISRELHGDSGSEGSEESGIFSTGSSHESPRKEVRRPGLGRRAITQLNMRVDKTNSYNNALAKSQENIVKISSDVGAEELFDCENSSIKKGLLWQQRDKIFSRWKERYFILTRDLLQCFKKETSKITEMGGFIFKIKLSEVDGIELLDKRGYLTICISLQREGKFYLRRADGIRDWFEAIRDNMKESRARKNNRTSAIFLDRRQNTDSSGMENWLAQRRIGKLGLSDSTPEVNKAGVKDGKDKITLDELSNLYRNEEMEQEETRRKEEEVKTKLTKKINRLSLMTDIELPDTPHSDLGIDLEKGIFLRRQRGDTTDSGNNSLNTNKSNSSTGTSSSSKQSQPRESSFMEEDEDLYAENLKMSPEIRITKPQINKNIIEVRYRERSSADGTPNQRSSSVAGQDVRRRSQHVNRLQITHV